MITSGSLKQTSNGEYGLYTSEAHAYFDDVRVRKFILPEPTVTTRKEVIRRSEEIATELLYSTEAKVEKMEAKGYDPKTLKDLFAESKGHYNSGDYESAIELMMTVEKKVDEYYYILSEYIEPAQVTFDEASSIGAEVDGAEELLNEAEKALNDGNFVKAQNYANKALNKANNADVGSITVKDLLAGAPKYDQRGVIILGTIKFIDMTYGEGYVFAIDDESGTIPVKYQYGLGEIRDGDRVIVSGLFRAADGTIIADDVSKALIFGIPGFEAVFGIIGLLAVAFILLRSSP